LIHQTLITIGFVVPERQQNLSGVDIVTLDNHTMVSEFIEITETIQCDYNVTTLESNAKDFYAKIGPRKEA
jgi:hypothetical protein